MISTESFRSLFQISVSDAIECMVATLGPPGPDLLLLSTIDDAGHIGPGDCFDLSETLPSPELVFQLAVAIGAPAVLCATRATLSVFDPGEKDLERTRWLIKGASEHGLALDEHILIAGGTFRAMRESIEEGLV